MDVNMLVYVGGATVVLLVGLLNFVESRRTRRVVEAAFGPQRGKELLAQTVGFDRQVVIVTGAPDAQDSAQESTAPPEPELPASPPAVEHAPVEPPRPEEPLQPDTAREPAAQPRVDLEALGREL